MQITSCLFVWAQLLQELLDQLEERDGNFVGVRSALATLAQLTAVTGSAKHDFKLNACPDLLRPFRRPPRDPVHVLLTHRESQSLSG